MKLTILLSAALFALHSCTNVAAPSATGSTTDLVAGVLAGELVDENAYASKDPARISVPILRAPDLEAKYGKPEYSVMADGSYAANHRLPGGSYLRIVGTPRPPKKLPYDAHGPLTLMGRHIGFFTTGNEDPEITSESIVMRAPDGRSATYVVTHGGRTGSVTEMSLSRGLPRLSW
jgi:hypothetical protein